MALALGYRQLRDDRAKWKRSGSVLSINHTQFYDHLRQCGGGGAIDLVLHATGCSFPEAVRFLENIAPADDQTATCNERLWPTVQHYLCHTRSLDPKLIQHCTDHQLIRTDRRRNAVFTMRCAAGQPVGAEIVGTHSRHRFRGLAKGSRRINGAFWITDPLQHDIQQCQTVLLVESAIDALSAWSCRPTDTPVLIVSTAGVVHTLPAWLANLQPQRIVCGYDDDATADFAAQCLAADPRVVRLRPKGVKDWNDLLRTSHTSCNRP